MEQTLVDISIFLAPTYVYTVVKEPPTSAVITTPKQRIAKKCWPFFCEHSVSLINWLLFLVSTYSVMLQCLWISAGS